MSKPRILIVQFAAVALIAAGFVGCSGTESGSHDAMQDAVKEAAAPIKEAVSETVVAAKLAGADLVDGTKDNVVSRCPGCALAMEGSADHAVKVGDYELHFCSESCQASFDGDMMANVAKLEIPES